MPGLVTLRSGFQSTCVALVVAGLAACGGGGESPSTPVTSTETSASASADTGDQTAQTAAASNGTSDTAGSSSSTSPMVVGANTKAVTNQSGVPVTTRQNAFRLLTQGTFGPVSADVASVAMNGGTAWLDAQLAMPSSTTFVKRWDSDNAAIKLKTPGLTADGNSIISQFYYHAINGKDQLRQRVAYALSQIMVVSLQGIPVSQSRTAASYMDMLNRDAFANYRTLIQDVTLHPAMGVYLNSLHNMKENLITGQIPDQNFAREVMQLFSIGLVQLNPNGTPKLLNMQPVETYSANDISGLSKALTGWSWYGPDTSDPRFYGDPAAQDPNRTIQPMQGYTKWHSTSAKQFLGVTIPAQQTPNPSASLATALDTIYNHPNVGPFIARQLIQRLVTSSPSTAYVGRVAAVFNNNGSGVRGDLKAVVRAILTDTEARTPTGTSYGKVREPVLRLTAWMRAFGATSDSGIVKMWPTDDPGKQLAQSPLRSPSVFNFYRPGYIAPATETGAKSLTMPELQITNETSVAGYINFMTSTVRYGIGQLGVHNGVTRADVQPNYAPEQALATDSASLVDDVTSKLVGDGAPDSYKAMIRTAVDSIAIPVAKTDGSNASQIDYAKTVRVNAAVLLCLVSPEFIIQK